jgi:hypothetical protein
MIIWGFWSFWVLDFRDFDFNIQDYGIIVFQYYGLYSCKSQIFFFKGIQNFNEETGWVYKNSNEDQKNKN